MGLRINTNVASLAAQRNLANTTQAVAKSFGRLSSGLRIAHAADDAAGLVISERMRAQIRSLQQAQRNANDGISLVQTAEGTLEEVSTILVRLRELATQSATGRCPRTTASRWTRSSRSWSRRSTGSRRAPRSTGRRC